MKKSVASIVILMTVLTACQKSNDNNAVLPNDIKGSWRIISQRSGPDTLNIQGIWTATDFSKQTGDYDLYCITDSRSGQSFISISSCSYQDAAGSYVGVITSDCSRTVYLRDTVWSQLTNFDILLKNDGVFEFLEQYNHSKRVNTINQHCTPVPYIQAYSSKNERIANRAFNETTQIITVDYGSAFSPFDGKNVNRYKVVTYSGNEAVFRLQSSYFSELKLRKL